MQRTSFSQKAILIAMLVSLFFTINSFAQTARQRAEAYKKEGDRYSQNQDYKTALEKYLKAIEADRDYAETYWSMAFALNRLHEHKLAGLSYIRYLERVPDTEKTPYVFYLIGNEYRLAKEWELSKTAFDLALQSTVRYVRDYDAIADIYTYRGNLAKTVEYEIKAINGISTDDDSGRYIGLSWHYSFLQQHQNAVNAATKAIQLDSTVAMAYTNRCRAYNDLQQYDKAIADCKKSLSLYPNHGETQYYLANSYRAKGNAAEATRLNKTAIPNLLTELEEAAKREDINLPDYCYLLGNAYFQDGRFADAVKAYEIGLEFKSNFPFLRFNLGMAYLKVRNKTGATEQYRELLKVDTGKANALKKSIDATR